MSPILFWILGLCSLAAGLIAVTHKKPVVCVQGLVGLMAANALLFLFLSATLLALEMLVILAAAGALVWFVFLRPKRLRLAAPGRVRISLARLLAGAAAGALFWVVWSALERTPQLAFPASAVGALDPLLWLGAGLLVGLAALFTAMVVVGQRRWQDHKDEAP